MPVRGRFGFLFAAIAASVMVEGTVPQSEWKQGAVTALLGGTLLLAFWAADMPHRRLRRAAMIVAAGVLAAVASLTFGNGQVVSGIVAVANGLLVALAPPAIVVAVVRSLRAHGAVTIEAVLGALCFFLLAGLFFAFVYGAIENLGGDPFFAGGATVTQQRLVYFSFTTLTTTGYGDFTARTDYGHMLSITEALFGQIYLVTIVTVIVSNLAPRRRVGREKGVSS
jgi:hypothetical protein